MKIIKNICAILLVAVILIPNTTFATVTNDKVAEMNNQEKIMSRYLTVDDKGHPTYHRQQALDDRVDSEIIEIADKTYEIICSYESYNDGIITRASVPIYGNWCGPEYGHGVPIDLLDAGCKRHDDCYGERGYHKCSCDGQLVGYIDRNINNMGTLETIAARAIRYWANLKSGNIDKTGNGGALSCVI